MLKVGEELGSTKKAIGEQQLRTFYGLNLNCWGLILIILIVIAKVNNGYIFTLSFNVLCKWLSHVNVLRGAQMQSDSPA